MLEADLLADRRRLKRRLNFWRVLAVFALVAIALVATRRGGVTLATAHIVRINVHGVIGEDQKLLDAVGRLEKDATVAAVIVSVDSPGGSVAGGESLHDALARLAAAKPVVTVMLGTAASAGYMVSLPAERIFAREATLTGSIGVILETAEFSGLLSRLGVDAQAITSGPLKDQPSFSRPLTDEGRAYLNGLVQDMFDQFVTMVASARHMSPVEVRKLADGRAYTGRQALRLGLVDEIGGEREARTWLAKTHGVADSVSIEDLRMEGLIERTLGGAITTVHAWLAGASTSPGAWALWTGR